MGQGSGKRQTPIWSKLSHHRDTISQDPGEGGSGGSVGRIAVTSAGLGLEHQVTLLYGLSLGRGVLVHSMSHGGLVGRGVLGYFILRIAGPTRPYSLQPIFFCFFIKLAKHKSARAHWAGSLMYKFWQCLGLGLHTGFSSCQVPHG